MIEYIKRINQQMLPALDDDNTDDRHIKDPEDYNSTNGPAEMFTKMPSVTPTSTPSLLPSLLPSSSPSVLPTISMAPSSRHSCSQYNNYNFGLLTTTTTTNKFVMNYNYDIETNIDVLYTMGDTMLDEINAIEAELLRLLIQLYFPECIGSNHDGNDNVSGNDNGSGNDTVPLVVGREGDRSNRKSQEMNEYSHDEKNYVRKRTRGRNRRMNIYAHTTIDDEQQQQQQQVQGEENEEKGMKLVGMSSRPMDMVNGAMCQVKTLFNNSTDDMLCYMIDGRMSFYYSNMANHTNSNYHQPQRRRRKIQQQQQRDLLESNLESQQENQFLHSIKTIMDDGQLNNCHPAIVNVTFRNTTSNIIENIFDDDFTIPNDDITSEILTNNTLWLSMAAGFVFLMLMILTRYRYHYANLTSKKSRLDDAGNSSSDSNDAFAHYGRYDTNGNGFDLVSSLTMQNSNPFIRSSSFTTDGKPSPKTSVIQVKMDDINKKGTKGRDDIINSSQYQRSPPPNPSIIEVKIDGTTAHNTRDQEIVNPPQNQRSPPPPDPPSTTFSDGDIKHKRKSTKEFMDVIQIETKQMKQRLDKTKEALREFEVEHKKVTSYLERVKQEPNAATLRNARLALLGLINDVTTTNRTNNEL